MNQYLLSVWHSPSNPVPSDPTVMQRMVAQVDAFNAGLQAAGAWVFAGGLHAPETATVVESTATEPLITDGPFAETKEHLGGFWVIAVPDLDAALRWAAQGSAACLNPVEVRPFQDVPAFELSV